MLTIECSLRSNNVHVSQTRLSAYIYSISSAYRLWTKRQLSNPKFIYQGRAEETMLVSFVKMQSLGNDFIILDKITLPTKINTKKINKITDRHIGVGCDQIIALEPPKHPESDFFFRAYNADGREVEQCGNGARCAAKFFYDFGLTTKKNIVADYKAGTIKFNLKDDKLISADMGKPVFTDASIPANRCDSDNNHHHYIDLNNKKFKFYALSLGNPHAIVILDNLTDPFIFDLAQKIQIDPRFPNGVNVSFMEIINKQKVKLRTFERGVGETLACGSGASAAVVTGIKLSLLANKVEAHYSLGLLEISWKQDSSIILSGPAQTVFVGKFSA